MGANSLQLSQIAERIEQKFGRELAVSDLFTYPSITDLAAYLSEGRAEIKPDVTAEPNHVSPKDIAIIGMSLNVPGASTKSDFWNLLEKGEHSIREYPVSRMKDAADYVKAIQSDFNENQFVKGGYLDEIDRFDYSFFGLAPKTAQFMDLIKDCFYSLHGMRLKMRLCRRQYERESGRGICRVFEGGLRL